MTRYRHILVTAALLCAPVLVASTVDHTRWSHHTIGFHEPTGLLGELLFQEHMILSIREGNVIRPFLTDRTNHPWGEDLGFAVANSAHLYFYPILRTILGPFQAYNAMVLLVTLLNFLAFYWLARGLFPSRPVALCAALFFAASPYLLLKLNLGFIQKYIVFWIPLYGLALLRLGQTRRSRHLVGGAVVLFLMLITYPPYAVYAALFTFLLLCFALVGGRSRGFAITRFLALAGLFGLVSALYYRGLGLDLDYIRNLEEFSERDVIREGCLNLFNPFHFYPYLTGQHPTHLPLGISATAFGLAVVGTVQTPDLLTWVHANLASVGNSTDANGERRSLEYDR